MDKKGGKRRNQKIDGRKLEYRVELGIGVLLAIVLTVLTIINYDPNSKKVLDEFLNGTSGATSYGDGEDLLGGAESATPDESNEIIAPMESDENSQPVETSIPEFSEPTSSSNSASSVSSDDPHGKPAENPPDSSSVTSVVTPTPSVNEPELVNINSASLDQLKTLSGIGDVKAQAIIDYRDAHGAFASIDELTRVNGIGDKTLEKIRDKITV